jgi:pimeloyl-ACP methyl ester carboxylesterase
MGKITTGRRLDTGLLSAATLTSVMLFYQVGRAQTLTVPLSGTIQPEQIDTLGLFGPKNADLGGLGFTGSISYDPADFGSCTDVCISGTAGAMTVSVTINGVTQQVVSVVEADAEFVTNPNGASFTADGNFPDLPSIGITSETSQPPTLLDPLTPVGGSGVAFAIYPNANNDNIEVLLGTASGLTIVSPFLLAQSGNLDDLDLSTLLPNLPSLASVTATDLAADGTSAAIVLFPTATTDTVTITTNNGTTLFPYDPTYMTYGPQTGGQSMLQVTPVKIGTLFYAAALLQAPLPGITPSYANPILVTAQQGAQAPQQATLPLIPPPVVMIHGLWGTAGSLSFYGKTLAGEQPWATYSGLIYYSAYSGEKSFADPKSISQLDTEISSELSNLQGSGVVVGRTDVIAHSMGGLLARTYSGSRSYLSDVNREQGQFHTIVTVDTPEDGSNLASYLIENQSNTLSPNASDTLKAIWDLYCGTSPTTTVAQCFFSADKQSITAGAVASLIPGSVPLSQAPSPDISNTNWFAVTATNGSGIERKVLQGIIDASNPGSDKLKLTQIIGGTNDDIVALTSQLKFSPLAYVTLPSLAHSEIFGLHKGAVTYSPTAIQDIACWINDPSSSSCSQPIPMLAASEQDGDVDLITGRVAVRKPPIAALVGQPLSLSVRTRGALSFDIEQAGKDERPSDHIDVPNRLWNGTALTMVPTVLGQITVRLTTTFPNGQIEIDNIGKLNVSVDPQSVLSICAEPQFHRLVFDRSNSHYQLNPEMQVRNVPRPVVITSVASYSVVSPATDPAVTVDSTGEVTSVHPGKATIKVSYANHADQVDVIVR